MNEIKDVYCQLMWWHAVTLATNRQKEVQLPPNLMLPGSFPNAQESNSTEKCSKLEVIGNLENKVQVFT